MGTENSAEVTENIDNVEHKNSEETNSVSRDEFNQVNSKLEDILKSGVFDRQEEAQEDDVDDEEEQEQLDHIDYLNQKINNGDELSPAEEVLYNQIMARQMTGADELEEKQSQTQSEIEEIKARLEEKEQEEAMKEFQEAGITEKEMQSYVETKMKALREADPRLNQIPDEALAEQIVDRDFDHINAKMTIKNMQEMKARYSSPDEDEQPKIIRTKDGRNIKVEPLSSLGKKYMDETGEFKNGMDGFQGMKKELNNRVKMGEKFLFSN